MGETGKKVPRYYWDACVFLSFIEGHATRAPTIEALLDECENKQVEIWSSHLSIVEVAFAKSEKDSQALDPAVEKEIDNLWHPQSPIKLVEVSELVCIGARMLIRNEMLRQRAIRSSDAVHLATAKLVGVDEFHTYDSKLLGVGVLGTIKICEPFAVQPLLLPSHPAPQPPPPPTTTEGA